MEYSGGLSEGGRHHKNTMARLRRSHGHLSVAERKRLCRKMEGGLSEGGLSEGGLYEGGLYEGGLSEGGLYEGGRHKERLSKQEKAKICRIIMML